MLLTGKEALIALANGEEVQTRANNRTTWSVCVKFWTVNEILSYGGEFRLKPRTITLNGIEVPAPFKPKGDCTVWILDDIKTCGYRTYEYEIDGDSNAGWFGLWQTEDEIKQVVVALREVFK